MATTNDDASTSTNSKTLEQKLKVSSLTTTELKAELKRRNLKTNGNKKELAARLETAIQDDVLKDDDSENNESESESGSENISESSDFERLHKMSARSRPLLTFRDVDESMETFSGDDEKGVKKWIKDFEEMALLCGWSEVHKVVYAKRLLRGSAKLFVSYENCCKSWETMKISLETEFSQRVDSRLVHRELSRRKKAVSETYQEYMYKMMEISSQIDIETEAVIQYIIDGIQDDEVNKIVLYGANTIKDFRSKLNIYESMKKNMNDKFKHKSHEKFLKPEKHSLQRNMHCFNCGAKNSHLSRNCPDKAKGVKCFRCNQYGHIAAQCSNGGNEKKSCDLTDRILKRKSIKEVKIRDKVVTALFDSGSDITLMGTDEYVRIGAPKLQDEFIDFRGVGLNCNSTLGSFDTDITVDDDTYLVKIHVVPSAFINCQLLLGTDFLQQVDVKLNRGTIVQVKKCDDQVCEALPHIFKINVCHETDEIDFSYVKDVEEREILENMIKDYRPQKLEETCLKMKIILKDEIPVYQRPRRLPACEKIEVNKQIQTWLKEGIIKESNSEYASPIVLVKKKDGLNVRICVDYRQLNKKVYKDRYPLPLIEDQLDRLEGAQIFSTLDLRNGFFHVPIEEDSQKYTAFVTPDGHYEFLRAPFGLCNSPAVFQKFINAVFKDLIANGTVITYLDDLIIPSLDRESGMLKLKRVLEIASMHGLDINWKKCKFLQDEIEYLGHIIQKDNVRPSEYKVAAVVKFPKPANAKAVQSFIGLTSYFRKFIPNYSSIARPLTNLLRDNVKFKFEKEEEEAFNTLKLKLSNQPVLKLYRQNVETELHTDASSAGFGAILLQKDVQDNSFHPVYYASGKTTVAEEKYTSYQLEVLAIVKALKKFRVYLLGIPFKIITDCKAFEMTMRKKDLCVRVARWALLLEEFQYTVEHRPGKNMKHVDSLSRNPSGSVMLIDENRAGLIERLKKAQKEDEEIRHIINNMDEINQNFTLKNGLLYKEVNDELVIVVPKQMQVDIIKEAHGRGHFAVQKTEDLIKKEYWFKNMKSLIEKVIKNCINCIIAERKQGKQEGFLNPIEKGERPFDTYHIDHLGHLASTKKRYQNIFAVVDAFTKFVWLYPTKSTGADEAINHLKKQAAIFGNPRRIISDRGSAFTSNAFEDYCKDEKIENIRITTGVPRSNGQIERVNRTVIPLLTKLSAPRPEEWYKYVDLTMQYLNSTFNRSIKRTSFELLFGARMRLKDNPEIREMIEEENILMFEEKRDQIREDAQINIKKIQEENRKRFNKKRKEATKYKEGDIVAIRRTQYKPNSKLSPKFLGPYRIIRILRNNRYVAEKVGEEEGPITTTSAADYMKPWLAVENDPELYNSENEDFE